MGDPRRLRKKFKRPTTPWEKARIDDELKILGDFGLRNRTELYKHSYQLTKFRKLARSLRAMPQDRQEKGNTELVGRLSRLGLIGLNSTTDDILSLNIEDILNRRLQTMVFKKGLARSIYQSRQFITHKHISVNGKVIASPSYLVLKEEEDNIDFFETSPFKRNPEKIMASMSASKVDEVPESAGADGGE